MDFIESDDYKIILVLLLMISVVSACIWEGVASTEKFTYSVDQEHQPNCVVGAYVMYAKDVLNTELLVKNKIEHDYPVLSNAAVGINYIIPLWDSLFPTNHLKCIYNPAKPDSMTNDIVLGKPYIWTGKWNVSTNNIAHTCLIYFNTNSVTYKHFVYDPNTKTNYMVTTNYDFFFERTLRLYTLK